MIFDPNFFLVTLLRVYLAEESSQVEKQREILSCCKFLVEKFKRP